LKALTLTSALCSVILKMNLCEGNTNDEHDKSRRWQDGGIGSAGPYYVSAIDAGHTFLMAGPYELHGAALAAGWSDAQLVQNGLMLA
jgi:hypothetical protein